MTVLETYLRSLRSRRGRTVPETGQYGELEALFNAAGDDLRPPVVAYTHPNRDSAGIPDLGLYDDHQPEGQKPARGVVEVKPTSVDLLALAQSAQVARYLAAYGQVLVTNLFQFVLVTRGANGAARIEERYDLADDETTFWTLDPRALAHDHDAALREYLRRVMRRNAPLASPQDVAWILASYARQAKARLEVDARDMASLTLIRGQLEAALGVRFQDDTAEEFFRSTLVQTLFYGLFSAWVLWHERGAAAGTPFDLWRDTRHFNVPVVQTLFDQFSAGGTLPSSVERIMEWTADALNRVDRAAFFERFNRGHAVQYFYEPFLEAFDPELRRQLGVWYTPPEVVEYMVAKVDAALRDELNIPDGLADPRVCVLDPCCGTGAYLVAVLRRIYATLRERDGDALAGQALQAAMRERIFGFEILPAPFVVAHLQIGILLNTLRAPLPDGQRVGVYLTNALTGWQPPTESKMPLMFPELEREREAADAVKRDRQILVVLGNPPYSGFAGLAIAEERDLTDAYRSTINPALPRPQGQGLNDLYVRFYRMAERRIAEVSGRGIVCFISNYSWLDGLSHTGMRERFLNAFDVITIDNLNGDKYKTGKTTPEGKPDPSIFSTEFNREGIQVGTAIATLIRRAQHAPALEIGFRPLWGTGKRAELLAESADTRAVQYTVVRPITEIGLPFAPRTVSAEYLAWPRLPELFPTSFPGVKTSHDDVVVHVDRNRVIEQVTRYLAGSKAKSIFSDEKIVRFAYRPFDVRWLYWDVDLLDRPRPEYFPHIKPGNLCLISQQRPRREWSKPQIVESIGCLDLMDRGASCFPLYLYNAPKAQGSQFDQNARPERTPNLSDHARDYLDSLGVDADSGAPLLFYHALALLHAPAYRVENAGALRQDWPRVPLPAALERLSASAALGQQVAALLDVDSDLPGVTSGTPRADLSGIATLTVADQRAPDFSVTVNWGYFGAGSAVMPGRGRSAEHDGLIDIYLNDSTYWRDIPLDVWNYTLGGYQVLKKWLSYRETDVLGRPLKADEARTLMQIARRIAALLALNDALDLNYRGVSDGERGRG